MDPEVEQPDAERPRRPRRTSAEVRSLILAAAADVFAAKGYDGATTREIARRAAVAEPTMFRIYPTKDALFEAAVLLPFEHFLDEFTTRWMSAEVPGGEPREVLTQFVTELHHLVADNRSLVTALATSEHLAARTRRAISGLEQVGEALARTHDLEFDVPVAVRIATIAVAATTMAEGSFFPEDQRGERLLAELTRMLVGSAVYVPPNSESHVPKNIAHD